MTTHNAHCLSVRSFSCLCHETPTAGEVGIGTREEAQSMVDALDPDGEYMRLEPEPSAGKVARTVDGVTYYQMSDGAGWSTGPCATVDDAKDRLAAWLLGDEISEACDGMASVLQMEATAEYLTRIVMRDVSRMQYLVAQALTDGLDSDAWIRATAQVVVGLLDEPEIANAGGARIRRTP